MKTIRGQKSQWAAAVSDSLTVYHPDLYNVAFLDVNSLFLSKQYPNTIFDSFFLLFLILFLNSLQQDILNVSKFNIQSFTKTIFIPPKKSLHFYEISTTTPIVSQTRHLSSMTHRLYLLYLAFSLFLLDLQSCFVKK